MGILRRFTGSKIGLATALNHIILYYTTPYHTLLYYILLYNTNHTILHYICKVIGLGFMSLTATRTGRWVSRHEP